MKGIKLEESVNKEANKSLNKLTPGEIAQAYLDAGKYKRTIYWAYISKQPQERITAIKRCIEAAQIINIDY